MAYAYDPNKPENKSGGKKYDAKWGRPIKDGRYDAEVSWVKDPSDRDEDAITFTFVIADHGPGITPEGAVRVDWDMKGARTKAFLDAYAFENKEYTAAELSNLVRKVKGVKVQVEVETTSGKTRDFTNVVRLHRFDPSKSSSAISAPAKTSVPANDEAPY